MQFNTKLNIGDTVWIICTTSSCIREVVITGLQVSISTMITLPVVTYITDDGPILSDDDANTGWWKTRDEILSHIMSEINSKAKAKTRPQPHEVFFLTPDEIADRVNQAKDPWKKTGEFQIPNPEPQVGGQCSCEEDTFKRKSCPCDCESRPTIEEEFDKFIKNPFADAPKQPKAGFLTPEQQQVIEEEFKRLFGPQAQERYHRAIKKTRNELDDLYEQIFGKEKKP